MKTIAQQLNVTAFPFVIKDKDGKEIYYEDSDGSWRKWERDANGKEIYCEHSDGSWWKSERDSNGSQIYCRNSDGFWWKRERDANGNQIYFENSYGVITDNRPKQVELTLEQIAAKLGINVGQLRIKD